MFEWLGIYVDGIVSGILLTIIIFACVNYKNDFPVDVDEINFNELDILYDDEEGI